MPSEIGPKEMILIIPVWHNQPWFPNLLARLINIPLILPNFHKIVTNPMKEIHPMILQNNLLLAACRVSGLTSQKMQFQMTLSISSHQHGERAQKHPTLWPGENGFFGTIGQVMIPYCHLSHRHEFLNRPIP